MASIAVSKFWRNVRTLIGRPTIAFDYLDWLLQSLVRSDGATRNFGDVKLGNFNGFSEFHSIARGISAAEHAFLSRHPFAPGAIIDIGANLGLFCLTANRLLPGRRVVAFEPAPSTFAALTKNVELNGAANIDCHQAALSDRDGTATFVTLESARANSSLAMKPTAEDVCIEISCVSLDTFVAAAGLDSIALLKVDVEGFEASVFAGANAVLSRHAAKLVYFEVCPALAQAKGFTSDEAAATLEHHGYALYRIREDGTLSRAARSDIATVRLDNWVGIPGQ